MMIDWISARVPFPHFEPINDGNVVNINRDGSIQYKVDKYLSVKGSYDSSMVVRSTFDPKMPLTDRFNCLEFSGNPVKLLQGHNVFGTSDLPNLLAEAFLTILKALGKEHLFSFRSVLNSRLTRVDLTASYLLSSAKDVENWLFSAEQSATLRHRGKGLMNHGTLYFGKNSTRWTMKFYHKGQEIKANSKHQRSDIFSNDFITDFADRALRCEVTLRGRELVKLGLERPDRWSTIGENDAENVYNCYMEKLELSNNTMTKTEQEVQDLPNNFKRTYLSWKLGLDMRELLSKTTYYKHRRYLLDNIGIDISIKQSCGLPDMTNVVPLVRYLEAKPASIPEWAIGTDLYFEPREFKL